MSEVLNQHLIDPEVCIRCNTCEETCPVGAISHDSRNYVVDPALCNACGACLPPCPTGSIDNWRQVRRQAAYGVTEQLLWDELPLQDPATGEDAAAPAPAVAAAPRPWSAGRPALNLFDHRRPARAMVVGNYRVTEVAAASDTRHIVLDFGSTPFPVLEGQSIGILPPGHDGFGRPHHARQYSIASPRDGERPRYNNLALTVKRVTADHDGRAVRGLCSNYLCDLQKGDGVEVTGPFGASFLMPDHAPAHLLMICTGTGAAPMRAMTERRRRLRARGEIGQGRLVLFFGARTREELPYFGPLMTLPRDFITVNLAFSRAPGAPRIYVQDLMRAQAAELGRLLADPDAYVYVCGLKAMEAGVLAALHGIAAAQGLDPERHLATLAAEGRLHLETY